MNRLVSVFAYFVAALALMMGAAGCSDASTDTRDPTEDTGGDQALSDAVKQTKLQAARVVRQFAGKSADKTGIRSWAVDIYAAPEGLPLRDKDGKPLTDRSGKPIVLKSAETMIGYRDAQSSGEEVVIFEIWVTRDHGIVQLPVDYPSAKERKRFEESKELQAALLDDVSSLRDHVKGLVSSVRRCPRAAAGLFWEAASAAAEVALAIVSCGGSVTGIGAIVGFAVGCGLSVHFLVQRIETFGESELLKNWKIVSECVAK